MKFQYVRVMDYEVDMECLVDSIFNGGATLYEALDEQGIDEDLLDDIFEKTPTLIEKLKLEMGKELLKAKG